MAKKSAPAKTLTPEAVSGIDSRGRNISITLLKSIDGLNTFSVTVSGDRVQVTTVQSAEEYLKAL